MITRRTLLQSLPGAAAGAFVLPSASQAEAPMSNHQVPAHYRLRLGEMEITALSDGYIPFSPEIVLAGDPGAVAAALADTPQSQPLIGHVNTYVVNTAGRLCLIDAGGPSSFVPTLGRLEAGLAAVGIDPAQIDQLLLTHLHIDHIGGLLSADGQAMFPNATLTLLAAEHNYWTDPALLASADAGFRPQVAAAQRAVAAYADRVVLLSGEAQAGPGISTLPIPGHTPGMAGYRLHSGDEQLLMWGDVVHVPAVQFAHPEWRLSFDTDGATAAASRARVLDMVASDRIGVLGSHLPFPGHGYVRRGPDGYRYEAAYWDHFA